MPKHVVEMRGDVMFLKPITARSKPFVKIPKILFYGNTSFSDKKGSGHQPWASLASELAEKGMLCEVIVCGLSGFTTQSMLKLRGGGPTGSSLDFMLSKDGPIDLVFVMTGTHDLTHDAKVSDIMEHIKELHNVCHKKSIPTVAIAAASQPALPELSRKLTQNLRLNLAKWVSSSAQVFDSMDVNLLVSRKVIGNWEDPTHLSTKGAEILTRYLATKITVWLQPLVKAEGPKPVALASGANPVSDESDASAPRTENPEERAVEIRMAVDAVDAGTMALAKGKGAAQT